jgi:hypothetical protein
MIEWTEVGLLISRDELLTEHGKVLCQMSDEIARLNRELAWYRDCAMGVLWAKAVEEEPF